MGEEADALQDLMAGESDQFYQSRLERLEEGFHLMRDGMEIKISVMKGSHLQNSINFGRRTGGQYWLRAIELFEGEILQRALKG